MPVHYAFIHDGAWLQVGHDFNFYGNLLFRHIRQTRVSHELRGIDLRRGIDETVSLHNISIKNTAKITEVFRRYAIKSFVDRGLLDHRCAERRFTLKILS